MKTIISYSQPYQFTFRATDTQPACKVIYVNEIHTVYNDAGLAVDSYKYANIPFKSMDAANAFRASQHKLTLSETFIAFGCPA